MTKIEIVVRPSENLSEEERVFLESGKVESIIIETDGKFNIIKLSKENTPPPPLREGRHKNSQLKPPPTKDKSEIQPPPPAIAKYKFENVFAQGEVMDELLSVEYLMQIHPALHEESAELLLKYCKENTIIYKSCYGDGSIMYPKWRKEQFPKLEIKN